MINLVVQSFGRESEYRRAVLTVLSFYAFCEKPVSDTSVILFTDQPEWFNKYFEGLPVRYVLLTADKIKKMRGEIDFLHRMKIALIEESFDLSEGDLLYADSDTFFIADPSFLLAKLSPERSFMHVHEYQFEHLRGLPLPEGKEPLAFLKHIESNKLKFSDGPEFQLTAKHSSWNAGVMMLHSSHRKYIPDVYKLTEEFYPATGSHASEQFAFSILLQLKTELQACEEVIYHYWYRIRKQSMDEFLEKNLNKKWLLLPLSEKLKVVEGWCKSLPAYMDNHIFMLEDNAIQAFCINDMKEGYRWTFKAFLKKPIVNNKFLKDVLYYTKRTISGNK